MKSYIGKKFILFLSVAVLTFGGFGVAKSAFNEQINYQGKLTDTNGISVANGSYNLKFRLCIASDCTDVSDPIWTETLCYSPDSGSTCNGTGSDQRVSLSNGLFSALLGNVSSLSNVNFNQTLYLEVQVGGSGTTPSWETLTPRKKLGAVPVAFEAKKLGGKTWAAPDAIGSGTPAGGAFTTLSSTGLTAIGNSSATIAIDSSDWDINTLGAMTGISGITTDGAYTQSGTSANTFSGASSFTASGTALSVTNNASIGGTLNVPAISTASGDLTLDPTGNVIIKGSTSDNTATALNVQNSGAGSLFYVRNDGNIGIGDTSPASLLTIGNGDLFQVNSSGQIAAIAGYTQSSGNFSISGTGTFGTGTGAISLNGDITIAANKSLSMSSGTGTFSIAGYSGTGNALSVTSSSTTDTNKALSISQTGATTGTDYGLYATNTGAGTTNIGGYFSASGATNNYGLIVENGRVGIGNTTPTYTLHVKDAGYDQITVETSDATKGATLRWLTPSALVSSIGVFGASSSIADKLSIYHNGGHRITIASDGKVGISKTAPAYLLELNTDSAGKPNGGSWSNSSDARLKTNIEPINGYIALEKITKLQGVSFEWINPEDHGNTTGAQGGFIAQEVEKIFPAWISEIDPSGKDIELVGKDEKVKSLGLPFEYDAYIVEAIKEQQKEIERLRLAIGSAGNVIDSSNGNEIISSFDQNQSFKDLVMSSVKESLASLTGTIAAAGEWTFGKITTQKLCVEDVCVDKSQLQELLNKNQVNTQPADSSQNNQIISPENIDSSASSYFENGN